eukprot:COSAG02_NODE_8787_length_2447_cov_2.224872_1_plen_80_part_00
MRTRRISDRFSPILVTVQTTLIFVAVAAVVVEGAECNVAFLGSGETSRDVAPCTNVLLQSSENCVRDNPIPNEKSGLPW